MKATAHQTAYSSRKHCLAIRQQPSKSKNMHNSCQASIPIPTGRCNTRIDPAINSGKRVMCACD